MGEGGRKRLACAASAYQVRWLKKKFDLMQKLQGFNRPSIFQLILMGVGLVLAVIFWVFLTGFVSCWQVTSLPGIPLPTCSTSKPNPAATNPGARR